MDFNLSPDQIMLKDSVDSFARVYLTSKRQLNRAKPEGFSRETWQEIVDLGWLGVELPEELGGYGGSAVETMLIHEGIGLGLIVEPLLSNGIAARLIGLAGSETQKANLLPSILAGERLAVLAHYENAGRGDPTFIEATAVPAADGWVLCGRKDMILDAPSSHYFVVSANLADTGQLALFVMEAQRVHGKMIVCKTIDGLHAADVILDGVYVSVADLMSVGSGAAESLSDAFGHGIIAMGAEALGAMDAALAMTIDYLGTRKQFGVTIGTFQALQHKVADMVVAVELARSILLYGASGLQNSNATERARAVSAVALRIIESAGVICTHAIQLHGGIGVTEEHMISHYFRKLTMLKRRLGSVDFHIRRI